MEVIYVGFKTEKDMADLVISSKYIKEVFSSKNAKIYYEVEPQGLFGIPDLIISNINDTDIQVFAFEFKLSNWKRALKQAFRYRSFAHYSYVLMDQDFVNPALNNIDEFKRTNIGLMTIDIEGNITVYFQPNFEQPYSERLQRALESMIIDAIR